MRIRIAEIVATVAAAVMLTTAAAHAQGASVKCKDGTTSAAAGKGACSGHGGVAAAAKAGTKAGTKAGAKVAKTEAKADSKIAKSEGKIAKTEAKADTKVAKTATKDAKQVKCTDGTMSKGGRGACSHHGGIAKG